MLKKSSLFVVALPLFFVLLFSSIIATSCNEHGVVKREKRTSIVSTENGEISAVRVINGSYLLHFFTLEPNALFLPVILHADMVFYVNTGSGRLSWTEENDLKHADVSRGDVYRLQEGSVFFIQSNLETERQKLRIHALFSNSNQDIRKPVITPYSSIRDMVLGFDRKVLQASFMVPEEVIDELLNATKQPAIIHGVPSTKSMAREVETRFIRGILRSSRSYSIFESNKKKKGSAKLFNIFNEDKDFQNDNGWSTTVTRKKLSALKGSSIGLYMVNLTAGSMMGPHWNPMATEIAIVLQGRGMVPVVCSDISNETLCKNTRFEVEVGDVFVVPRFSLMAQMAFNNDTFVFMGFSTSSKKNHPQYLAGQASVLRTLDKDVLALSFNVSNTTTLDHILASQRDSVILGCTSCAEEELRVMQEEIEKKREEAREREEEETRKREEERRKEEEEARKREEEAARRQEEERRKREAEEEARKRREEEEERKREEEEAREKEEERRKREEEEEEERRREEEEARKREEEEARRQEEERKKREKEEEQAARRAEEERQRQEEEARKEEEAARRQEEERKRHEEEQEEASRRAEEEQRQREEEEAEAARKREEEERQRQEQEAAARRAEEVKQRQRQEEEQRQREEAEAEERRQREQEEAAARRAEEERQRQEEEQREAEERRRREEEETAARRAEEESRQRREGEAEAAAEEERRMEEEARREEEEGRRQERERERGGSRGGDEEWIPKKRLTV
ncbi:hypothetical protein RD792_001277 [Penstemon davidsonii]|uniref:Cupin type-1 domain-containing protein n=1 Tax=Penstemon davidsonii TaxID=160366 RepID=A0ABR0DMZ9_9LAMI|nr:hypothetical protein RD792_001277 [Penstemon davidsonii]